MKYCPSCKQTKALTEFYIRRIKKGVTTYRCYCIACGKKQRDTWRKASPKDNERNKAYNKKHAKRIWGMKLVKNYWPNLTGQEAIQEWQKLYTAQNGLCKFGHKTNKLHVDHCHDTKVVRGLLCYNCNNGLGRFKDDIDVLKQAIEYLKKFPKAV